MRTLCDTYHRNLSNLISLSGTVTWNFCGFLAGELDPDRMGSGIQYGDPSLRRTIRPGKQEERPKCAC